MTDTHSDSAAAPAFLKAWDDYAAACQGLMERLNDPAANPGGAVPLAYFGAWKEFAKKLGMPSDPAGFAGAAAVKPEDMFASFLPALGHSREYQAIAQRMLDLSAQFHLRSAEFLQQGADIAQRAMEAIKKKSAADASLLSSAPALYDAWIDCAEEAYGQTAHGEPFAKLLAQLCNILSSFKIERGKLLEALARQLDLPSRAEVDTLHRQVRDLIATRSPKPRRKLRKSAGK